MDAVEEMMESLEIDESSFDDYDNYIDYQYEFDACRFFDFTVDETNNAVERAERWFLFAPGYPPAHLIDTGKRYLGVRFFDFTVVETNNAVERAERWFLFAAGYPSAPYMLKIDLTNILQNADSTSTPKLDDSLEHESPSIVTPDSGMASSEEKFKGLKYHNLFADDQTVSAKSKPTKRSSKPSKTFMKPTASHLAKQVNPVDIHGGSCGRTPEETKRQKLEIGFLRKVSHLKHQISFSHKSTAKDAESEGSSSSRSKTTIPQKPRLMTEERAQRRSFMSQKKAESHTHNFKALPLNRKIFESPSLSMPRKSVTDLPELQKFVFTYDN